MDPADPGGGGDPPDVMLDFGAPVAEVESDPDMIPGAEEVTGAVEEGGTEGERSNQNWFGGLITVIIIVGLFIGFRGIMQGNLALLVASTVVCIVIPVACFVGVIGWRAGSVDKKENTARKEEK